ncbi:hypothetical protein ACFV4P_31580 [Kitasatospora sp. NPDC059795]|uniref:hypothetical protein n=1 Tax=Kitasatospora sp. NPDC059795 TaxID=3346949 RepID=UPI00364C0A19
MNTQLPPDTTAERLAQVRWIAGGTAAGKSTAARALAEQYGVEIFNGDRAEHSWLARCTPQRHPHLAALRGTPPGGGWEGRTPEQVFRSMAGLHGETVDFLVDDLDDLDELCERCGRCGRGTAERLVVVDYFGILPDHLAPLLTRPEQAVFLLPTPEFRAEALRARYADRQRARATWGSGDPSDLLALRLARDALWDREVRRQAERHGLDVVTVDGSVPAAERTRWLAARFGLAGPGGGQPPHR